MKRHRRGFASVEVAIVILVIVLVGVVGWRAYVAMQTSDEAQSATVGNDEVKIPEGWVKYENTDYGFSFAYPAEYGDVELDGVNYGSGGSVEKWGPRRTFSFTGCDECTSSSEKKLPIIEVALNSRDFGGIGTSMRLAVEAGYEINPDGTYSVFWPRGTVRTIHPDGSLSIFRPRVSLKTLGSDGTYSITWSDDGYTESYEEVYSETTVVNQMLFTREKNEWHEVDVSLAVGNLPDGSEYSGVSFMAFDDMGKTEASEVLRSIAETYQAN